MSIRWVGPKTTRADSRSGEVNSHACYSVYREFITSNRARSGRNRDPSVNYRPEWHTESVLSDVVIPFRGMTPLRLLADFQSPSQNTVARAGTCGRDDS